MYKPSLRETQPGTQQELGMEAESTRTAASWLAPHGLFSLLYYKTQDNLTRGGTIHSELGRPTSITND